MTDWRGDLLKIGIIPDDMPDQTNFVLFNLDELNDLIKDVVEKAIDDVEFMNSDTTELDRAREEGREELLNSIVVGIEQLRSIVMMFNPMSAEIRAKQSGEIEAYNGLLEKLSKLTTK